MAVKRGMGAGQRRLVYGANVGVNVGVASAILIVAIVLGGRFNKRVDLTDSDLNSLSERTQKLLSSLPETVTITALFAPADAANEAAQRRQDTVRDLLQLYEAAADGRVQASVIDPVKEKARVRTLLDRLRNKPAFVAQAEPYRKAFERFNELNARMIELGRGEFVRISQQLDQRPELQRVSELGLVAAAMQEWGTASERVQEELDAFLEVQRYSLARETVQKHFTQVRTLLNNAADWALGTHTGQRPPVPPDVLPTLDDAAARYRALADEIADFQSSFAQLGDLDYERVYAQLSLRSNEAILLETANDARAIVADDIWSLRDLGAAQDDVRYDFLGEQGLSSAILRLVRKERTGLVFVRFGGAQLLQKAPNSKNPLEGRYEALNELLKRENFVTAEWDLRTISQPPKLEDVARTVYVVLPPTPPMPERSGELARTTGVSAGDVEVLRQAVLSAGKAVFLIGARPPTPMMPLASDYPYSEFLRKDWGIAAEHTHYAMLFSPLTDPTKRGLWAPANESDRSIDALSLFSPTWVRFTDHPIAKPLQASAGVFSMTCPLFAAEPQEAPADVVLEPVAQTASSEKLWAVGDTARLSRDRRERGGTDPGPDDILSPFPIAIASTRADGGKLVAIGSEYFVDDNYTQRLGQAQIGDKTIVGALYPANYDLFVNALYWLTGDADRIAVGPQRGAVPSLDKLNDGWETRFCRVFVLVLLPGVAVVIGAAVWFARRR